MSFVCDTCGSRYKHKNNLLRHRRSHNSTIYKCEICQSTFKRLDSLKRHTRLIHTPSSASSASPESFKRKLENETPVPRKKQRRRAKERLARLADESDIDDDHSFDHDDVELNAVLRENWQGIKTHTRVTKNSTFINVRWTEASPPDFKTVLTPFFENTKSKFKIQASHGFILKKNIPSDEDTDVCLFVYTGFNVPFITTSIFSETENLLFQK